MADAAQIGSSNSSYTGNAALGGGSFGNFQLNTKPVEDYARYVMLYNKAEYDQRQKDAEKAADEIADLTSYDLTSGIPKDAKVLTEKYDKLTAYVRDNPNALDYRNKKEWAEYKKMRNDLDNDLRGAKIRNTMWALRQKEISDQPDERVKRLMQEELDAEIERTDIRTPILHSQKYDDAIPEMPKANEVKFDITVKGPNENVQRDFSILDMNNLWGTAIVAGLEMEGVAIDPTTPEGKRRAIRKSNDIWQKGAAAFNKVLNDAKKEDGTIDESKLDPVSLALYNKAKDFNKYSAEKKAEIKSGVYKDKLGNAIQFDGTLLKEENYKGINVEDGIDQTELAALGIFSDWKGDGYKTEVQLTDNALQLSAQALQRRGQDLENSRFWAAFNKGNMEDLLSADAVIREVTDAVNSGTPKQVKIFKADGSTVVRDNIVEIADPNLIREFGNIDKDGNITNLPSVVHFNAKNNKLALVYYKKDDSGNVVLTEAGFPVHEREIEMLPTQWLGQVVKRKNPNKDIGGINTLIDQVYNKYGRDLKKLATEYRGGATISTNSKTTESGKVGGSTWDKYKVN